MNTKSVLCLTLLAISCGYYCESARILAAVFTPAYSHQSAFWPIWRELSHRGHHVTLLTTDPMRDPSLKNLTEIDLSLSYDVMKSHNTDELLSSNEKGPVERYRQYVLALSATADAQLSHPEVKALINNKSEQFDLLMVEVMFPTQMAFAERFKVPFIGLTSLDAPPRIHAAIGNPIHPSLYPEYSLPFVKNLSFWQRLASALYLWVQLWSGANRVYPREDETVRKHFGVHMPPLAEIQGNMSMLFINTNPVFHNIRPLVPATVLIGGGLHFKRKTNTLPADLQEYLDESKDGFVYFNLGSNVKSNQLRQEVKDTIVQTLSELPYRVLWKFEDEDIPNKPKNVKIIKWAPQQEVLAHPNIKVFITQGGLQSLEEAIATHVPVVVLPFYGDQHNNAKIVEEKALGRNLSPDDLKKDEFKEAIMMVAKDERYKLNMVEMSKLFSDQEMSGLDKAIWWTEYVIRHKGARHLRCRSLDLPFYQYYCLDVMAFLLVVALVTIHLARKLFRWLYRKLCELMVGVAAGDRKKLKTS